LSELDLSPRAPGPARSGRRRARNGALVGVVVVALSFVLFQALTSARVFFYNVDEAVDRRDELTDRTFRMQGVVLSAPSRDPNGAFRFAVGYNEVQATIHHVGAEPTDLFEVGIPVVVEGRWDGAEFRSQQIFVKHSEEYIAENPQRLDYDGDGTGDYGTGDYGTGTEPASPTDVAADR
jgi:cytochrome c-type biogenesis protein CcmE